MGSPRTYRLRGLAFAADFRVQNEHGFSCCARLTLEGRTKHAYIMRSVVPEGGTMTIAIRFQITLMLSIAIATSMLIFIHQSKHAIKIRAMT